MRRLLVLCLLTLLLSLQHEAQVHAFSHIGLPAGHAHESGLASTLADTECAKCALLATGSNTVPAQLPSPFVAALADESARAILGSRAVAAPVHFSSRAPPVIS